MSFTSFWFVFFFIALIAVRQFCRSANGDKWVLLLFSMAFYLTLNVPCVFLVLFISLLDFTIGRRIASTPDLLTRRLLLVTSLAANLGLLGFFKYSGFILDNIGFIANSFGYRLVPSHYHTILPPGISYFTFASISYILDVYYERTEPARSPRDYTLFIAFFPKLLSGPIVRAADFLPQLAQRTRAGTGQIEAGVAQLLIGAVKKMVIADQIAGNVNQIFAAPSHFDHFTLFEGLLGYTVQLYCDFSGYSDMAIGVARILGFEFKENFQMPYSSVTITEFWRRWHISLSTWFRDYLFLPLEMATRSNPWPLLRMSLNMTTTMLLCGLWHGPSWNYVIWGGIHGAALATHKIWTTRKPSLFRSSQRQARFIGNLASRLLTLGLVIFANVFFRTDSLANAKDYFTHMLSFNNVGDRLLSVYILPACLLVFLVHVFVNKDRNLAQELPVMPAGVRVAAYGCLLILLVCLAASHSPPFIYSKY
jgi:alginate O-acetyltransferase complex protein AlgI